MPGLDCGDTVNASRLERIKQAGALCIEVCVGEVSHYAHPASLVLDRGALSLDSAQSSKSSGW